MFAILFESTKNPKNRNPRRSPANATQGPSKKRGEPGSTQEAPREHQEAFRSPASTGSTQEAPRKHPGGNQEATRRHPGGTQEAPRDTKEAPRRLPGGIQDTREL